MERHISSVCDTLHFLYVIWEPFLHVFKCLIVCFPADIRFVFSFEVSEVLVCCQETLDDGCKVTSLRKNVKD